MKFYEVFKSGLVKAHALRTLESDPLLSFCFKVQIEGLDDGIGFQKVGGISREIEVIEYFESMYEHAHKLPGRESFGEVTFERGMFKNAAMYNKYEQVFKQNNMRSTVTVLILDRLGKPRRKFVFNEAWFSKYELADLDATSSDVLIETLTLVFEDMLPSELA